MDFLLVACFLVALLIIICGFMLITLFNKKATLPEAEPLNSEFKSDDESTKTFHKMTFSEIVEFTKECRRIDDDHSLEKKYIRFCLDELTEYPSGYVLTLKASELLPDFSEKGLSDVPSFRDVCAEIKYLSRLEDCVYKDPKICKLPFIPTGLEGNCCDSYAEICDGAREPYVSFWLKRFIPEDA